MDAVGGDIMFIEAIQMPGKGQITLTGQLGDVMKESAQAAWSLLRARAGPLGIPLDAFTQTDVHLHLPAGAVPKDGPSAGIAIATALASLLCRRPARHDVAMTGELTLRGRILPIGGLKRKLTAAARAGVKTVLVAGAQPERHRGCPRRGETAARDQAGGDDRRRCSSSRCSSRTRCGPLPCGARPSGQTEARP